jgi:hypothetical protein
MDKRGKTLSAIALILVLAVLIIIPFILSADTGNIKTYNENTNTITIKDNSNSEIASIKLNTPQVNYVPRGYQKVAEFTINSKIDYNDALKQIEFYNLKDNNQQISRTFDYKVKDYEIINVDDYEEVCSLTLNGTQNCENVKSGYHSKQKEIWIPLEKTNFKEGETLTIGIFTNVQKGDNIEWIPTFYGVKINEWAVWTESLNAGLRAYYSFENSPIDNLSKYNISWGNPAIYTSGVVGRATSFNGSQYGTITKPYFFNNSDFSMSVWLYNDNTGGYQGIITEKNNAWSYHFTFIGSNIPDASHYWVSYEDTHNMETPEYTPSNWEHYVVTFDADTLNMTIYIDGSYWSSTIQAGLNTANIQDICALGVRYTNILESYNFQGDMDELGIWNRTLTASEVSDLWNNGNGIAYESPFVDATSPTSTAIISSDDESNKSNQNLNCYSTLIDNEQANLNASWTWYKDDDLYLTGTKINIVNNSNTLITTLSFGNLTKGQNWKCEIKPFDGTNWGNATNSSSLTILNSAPTQNNPILSTPSNNHPSTENLTCNNQSTTDVDKDNVINIYNWIKNGTSLLSLNLPLDINTNDYSGAGNDGINNGATLTNTGCKLGNCYSFDEGDSIIIPDDSSLYFTNKKTWEIWFKRDSTGAETIFNKGNSTKSNYKLEILGDNKLKFSYSLAIGDVFNSQFINGGSNFNEGTYLNTYYNSTINAVKLTEGQNSGNYTSKIFNANSNAEWNNISWSDNIGSVLTLVDVNEGIYKSINQGSNWTLINSSYGGAGSAVEIIESINGILYIVNDREEVWKSTNFGVSWTKQIADFNGAENSNAVTMTGDGNHLYIIEDDEDVWKSDNSGLSWTKVNDDLDSGTSTSDIKGAIMNNSGNIYAIANDAKLYKSIDNGTTWTKINDDFNGAEGNSATDISIDNDGNLYILNLQEIWKSTNAGVSWTKINNDFNSGDGNNGMAMTIDINNFIYIVDASEDVYRSTDGGISWSLLISNLNGGSGNVMSIVAYDQPTAKFQIRSCDDTICSGETFIGPDGTSSSYYLDSPEETNISDNQYFQFIAYFSTYDLAYSPELYGVNFNYTTQSNDLETSLTTISTITDSNWHLATISYDGNNIKIYLDGNLDDSINESRTPGFTENNLIIGDNFTGYLDEFRIYNLALSPEQILNDYYLGYKTLVSQETTAGETYGCSITPNDGEEDGITKNSNTLDILVSIVFNVTSGEDGSQISNFNIYCNNSFSASGVSSPYTAGFEPESYSCTFSNDNSFNITKIFVADSDKTVDVVLSLRGALTIEEHTWLEAIYICVVSGDCNLYNMLVQINQTVSNIWENTAPTNENVIITETITNKVVDSSHNLTINYSVNIPIKAGYTLGTYLPVRIGYWFLNEDNTSCYNQGTKPTGVEDPYCQPLIIETLGPMGGSVNFTVKLHPNLPAGDYSIKRIIDIDPNNVWINYGQENIGSFVMSEGLSNYGITAEKTGETNPSVNSNQQQTQNTQETSSGGSSGNTNTIIKETIIKDNGGTTPNNGESPKDNTDKPTEITGGVIGALLSGKQITFIITILCGTFIIFIIVRSRIIKFKNK